MKHLKSYAALLVLTLAAGCAAFGLEAPKSTKEQLAYGYSTLAGLRNSAAMAVQLKTLSVGDAIVAEGYADQVRQGLDAARFAITESCPAGVAHGLAPDPNSPTAVIVRVIRCDPKQTPIDQLALANRVLLELTKYLNQRGIK